MPNYNKVGDTTMVAKKKKEEAPILDSDAKEKALTAKAITLVEKQLEDGTAPPSVLMHYLRLSSSREKEELKKLRAEVSLVEAKAMAIVEGKKEEQLMKEVFEKFQQMSGNG